ncbi:hypothetical protein GGX14DRAFT_518886 [Mycena pura]|uniref:Rad4-domain-containing protein n=1 Tax=Mycena pura TaxID=153505 RepID=A0AAD6VK58_9AGAR|nr:hypothetical protein GGX14DRAFT_518886 [Mycena pura]
MSASGLEPDSDSEGDWEEVLVPKEDQNLEITISTPLAQDKSVKLARISAAERLLRINCHKLHTLALLASAWTRNKWINDPLLHARLLSLTPLSLQTAFAMIHKSRVPEQYMRGRMFETAMGNLAEWWSQTFFEVAFDGHLRNRTFDAVQNAMGLSGQSDVWDVESLQDVLDDDGECIRGPTSLMKHALMQRGTRDTSAQLFTALCRGLGIPARLVVSLQSVPWQSNVGKPKPRYGKGKAKAEDTGTPDPKNKGKAKADASVFTGTGQRLDGGVVPEKSDKAKGKEKAAPVIKLRNAKRKGNVLGSRAATPSASTSITDPTTTPPVFWTEVFSRPDARWLPVDPVRNRVNQGKEFDPSYDQKGAKRALADNRMVYVLAFEDDGFARDVTRRYARRFAERVVKTQGARQAVWWGRVVEGVTRPYRLHRDDVEDAELDTAQLMEGMPSTVTGFKDHPMYVLARHLTQAQTIHPPPPLTRELGKFRGEPVYPRSAVVSLKTAENWLRSAGRRVKEGEQPLRLVKARASTLGRMREVEVLKEGLRSANGEGEGETSAKRADNEVMAGMYALSQTELYVPDPVVDGIIPKNNFGNIDLYVPSMLPAGAAHIPFKGTAKIARQLGFSYAEAVVGFEFRNRRATPNIQGIVVAAENEDAAYWEAQNDAAEKARARRRDQVLKRWVRLVHGLRIRQSLQDEYKDRQPAADTREQGEDVEVRPGLAGGGFIAGPDAVVQVFNLPKAYLPASSTEQLELPPSESEALTEPAKYDLETMDVDSDPDGNDGDEESQTALNGAPKSMQQLAAETAVRLKRELARDNIEGEDVEYTPLPSASAPKVKKRTRQAKPSRASERDRSSAKTKAKTNAPAARRVSARKRRDTGTESASDEDASEGDESPPAKRAKTVSTVVSVSGRTLRPRRAKTGTELEEEQERERVFQRAVAR